MLMRSPLARDRRQPPGFIRPCQPVLSAEVPVGGGWIHQIKHDGFRIVALKDGGRYPTVEPERPELERRLRRDHCRRDGSPGHEDRPRRRGRGALPEGLPDFHALLGREGCARACLYAFDLLVVGAEDLRGLTLVERRALLREHLKHTGAAIIYSEHMEGADGEAMFRHACGLGLEGTVSKRATSRYRSGRCLCWVKVKNPDYVRR
jgi:bifunctional non-homologous end joining protein LigD